MIVNIPLDERARMKLQGLDVLREAKNLQSSLVPGDERTFMRVRIDHLCALHDLVEELMREVIRK